MERKVALITGASRGIGKEVAIELAKAGCDIVINYIGGPDEPKAVMEELTALGCNATAIMFDVSKEEDVNAGIAEIMAKYGRIDILINNAGITRDGLFMRMTSQNWLDVININLNSAFFVTNPVAKVMIKQRSGSIVNLASISGVYGNPGQANYSSAKAGLIGLTKSLAKELAARNIRVNAVAPGFIQTDMTKDLPTEQIVDRIPLKKMGQVSDVSSAIKFLALDAPYITGQILGIDGGLTI